MGKIIRNGNTISSFNYGTGTAPTLITKTITENNTYNASDDNADGYSSVTVNVQPTLITKTITENDTYDATDDNADGYSSVTVNVPTGEPCLCSSGTQSITLPVKASENLTFKFDLYFSYGPTNVDYLIIGDVFSTSGWLIHTRITDLGFRWGSGSNYAIYSSTPWAKNEIEVNTIDGTLKINGVTQTTGHTVSYTSGEDIKLFGVASHYSVCCMGAMEVYKDGNLYMKLSPRVINDRACYYDEIGETAYYSTTGTDLDYVEMQISE